MTATIEPITRITSDDGTHFCSRIDAGRKFVWLCTGWSEDGGIRQETYLDDGMSAEAMLARFIADGKEEIADLGLIQTVN